MRSERRKQIMTLSILVVAVLVISVGFAAYSSTLRIDTDATVNPNANTFSVKFSTTKDTLTVADVIPTNYTTEITVTNGKIDNSGNPTISDLTAQFKNPGDYVEYVFYARNEGEYNAYLNNINFVAKTCTAGEGATERLVNEACNSISATVTVGGVDYTTTTGISNHVLNKKTGEEIKVTLKYADNGARADGPFTVNFGDITLVYSTINDSSFTPPVQAVCSIERQVAGTYTVGDVVTCGEEQFYVIENESEDTTTGVDMLAKYNITLSTTAPIQDPTDTGYQSKNAIAFSTSNYWYDSTNQIFIVDANYASEGRERQYVYGNYIQNNIYPYVEAYTDVLEGMGVNVIEAKLLSYEQAKNFGCAMGGCSISWISASSSWLGSSYIMAGYIYYLAPNDGLDDWSYSINGYFGIRPLITIQTSDLG